MNVLLVGEEAITGRVLRMLAERGDDVTAVLSVSNPDWGRASVAAVAAELGVTVLPPDRVRDPEFGAWIEASEVDLLLNVHSLHIIDAAVLGAPRVGSFNLHPGPLPRRPGLNSPSWAIAEGESEHAVTVHWMAPAVDAGPIAYERRIEISPTDRGLDLSNRCAREGLALLERLLGDAERGEIPRLEQESGAERIWRGTEVPHQGWLPWGSGARRVVDLVRAADYAPFESPWGPFRTSVEGTTVEVLRVSRHGEPTAEPAGTVGASSGDGVLVSAGDEWVLVERIRVGGESVPPTAALAAGAVCAEPG